MKFGFVTVLMSVAVFSGCSSLTKVKQATSIQNMQCKPTTEQEITSLFEQWNQDLQSGQPQKVVQHYAEHSLLLPTMSNQLRFTAEEKADYFKHFMENAPSGKVETRFIDIGCNTAIDAGIYTFSFAKTGQSAKARYSYTYKWNGKEWLITSHHSSLMPES